MSFSIPSSKMASLFFFVFLPKVFLPCVLSPSSSSGGVLWETLCMPHDTVHAPQCFLRTVLSHMLICTGLGAHGEAEDWEIHENFNFDYIKRVSNAVHWQRHGRSLNHERHVSWWPFFAAWESWEEFAMTCIQKLIALWAAVLGKSGSSFPYQSQLPL